MNKNKLITVIGSSNFDIIIAVKNNPRPGESILAKDLFTDYGGKGATQAVTASKLGGNVRFLTCLGDDLFGKLVLDNLKKKKINLELVKVCNSQKNGMAAGTFDDKGENIVICYPGANSLLKKDVIIDNLDHILGSDIILTQLEIPLESVELLSIKKTENNILILNPSPLDNSVDYAPILKNIDILIPNEIEMGELAGMETNTLQDIKRASGIVLEMGVKNLVITLGGNGVLVKNSEFERHIKAEKVKVLNTVGGGDIFAGAFTYYLSISDDLLESAVYANKAAAISVTREGTQSAIPLVSEIEEFEKFIIN